MRKKKEDNSPKGASWMDTYGDMVTLLLTFFVMLYSISSTDSAKWEFLVKALAGKSDTDQIVVVPNPDDVEPGDGLVEPGGDDNALGDGDEGIDDGKQNEGVMTFDDLYIYLKQYVEENKLHNDIELNKGEGYTFITFRNNIFFDGDSDILKPEGKKVLDHLTEAFKNIAGEIGEVRAFGHTALIHDPNNYDMVFDRSLSSMRAANVISYIDTKKIISTKITVSEGYGNNWPVVPHDGTEATRKKNRRVELYIAKKSTATMTIEEIYEAINKDKNNESNKKKN